MERITLFYSILAITGYYLKQVSDYGKTSLPYFSIIRNFDFPWLSSHNANVIFKISITSNAKRIYSEIKVPLARTFLLYTLNDVYQGRPIHEVTEQLTMNFFSWKNSTNDKETKEAKERFNSALQRIFLPRSRVRSSSDWKRHRSRNLHDSLKCWKLLKLCTKHDESTHFTLTISQWTIRFGNAKHTRVSFSRTERPASVACFFVNVTEHVYR